MKTSIIKDAAGTIFDPRLHQIRYGKPLIRRKDGRFVPKKGAKNVAIPHETVPNVAESHVDSVPFETAQNAESLVDGILDAGESVPTVPVPDRVAEVADSRESFVPEDLTFPEESSPEEADDFFDSPRDHGDAEKPKMSAEAANISAFSIVEITEQTAAVLLGEEMLMKPEEKRRLIQAWENYLATTEGFELPPWAALLGLNVLYFGTRLMLPGVQEKLSNIWRNLNGQPPLKSAEAQSVAR